MGCRISLRQVEESLSKEYNLDYFTTNHDSPFERYECSNDCMFARGLDNKWNM